MPTRMTAAKLDQAVKDVRTVIDCQDGGQHIDVSQVEEVIRTLLQARAQFWNKPQR